MREHPDHHDAELLLSLYDLRREAKLRQAREWVVSEFEAKTFEEFVQQYPAGSEKNASFRMTISYWDMAASLVNNGLIKEDFFFENTTEFWIVWDKVRKWTPTAREAFKNPLLWKNLESLTEKYEQWMGKRAPQALEARRRRLQEAAAKKPAASRSQEER